MDEPPGPHSFVPDHCHHVLKLTFLQKINPFVCSYGKQSSFIGRSAQSDLLLINYQAGTFQFFLCSFTFGLRREGVRRAPCA